MDPYTPEGKAAANIALQNLTAALDSSGICLFTTFGIGPPELLAMLTAATLKHHRDRRREISRRLLSSDGRCLGAVLWNACDDLGILSWLISTRRDCSGWEDRVARGENLCADTLGLKQARGPLNLF